LNPYTSRRWNLNPVRLPFRHLCSVRHAGIAENKAMGTLRVSVLPVLSKRAMVRFKFMEVRAKELKSIPLFRDIPEKHLEALQKEFTKQKLAKGDVLFRAGETDSRVRILLEGEVTLVEEGQSTFRLAPMMLIGELGGLTGTPRNATATASKSSHLLVIEAAALVSFFESNSAIALPFYRGLLALVSQKVRRDKERLDQMRANIIRTQKGMKELRDLVLAKTETPISKPICDALESHIARNRRAGYRVTPTEALPAAVKLADGSKVQVLEVSNNHLKLASKAKQLTKDKALWVGVLTLPTTEIPVSGSITREGADGTVVSLDTLLDEGRFALEDYVTRVQMLDYVV
jgi:CRP/FNR family transcriptional regulator, cyclic AMP receptor protein